MNETKIALRVATGLRMSPRQTALLLSRTERRFIRVGPVAHLITADHRELAAVAYPFDALGEKRPRRRGQRKFEGWGNFAYNDGR